MKRFENILCVLESQTAGECALERAASLAEHNQAVLTVIDVIPRMSTGIGMPDGGPISLELRAAMIREHEARLVSLIDPYRKRLDIKHSVLVGTAFLEIIRAILRNGHDLVVKSPETPDWLDRFFSSDDMHLLRKCPCPVWLVKPGGGESYQRILAAVDVNDSYPPEELKTRQALNRTVMELAGSLAVSEFAELHVVNAWEAVDENTLCHSGFIRMPEDEVHAYVDQVRQNRAQRLDELMRETGAKLGLDAMEYIEPQLHLQKGEARKEIPALAERLKVDCIVMGTIGRTGIRGFFMGNTAETILEQIDCSVLAIKPPGFITPVELEE